MSEYRPIKISQHAFEGLIVKALSLPPTTTGFTVIPVPVEIEDDELVSNYLSVVADNRMEHWWAHGGYQIYLRAK